MLWEERGLNSESYWSAKAELNSELTMLSWLSTAALSFVDANALPGDEYFLKVGVELNISCFILWKGDFIFTNIYLSITKDYISWKITNPPHGGSSESPGDQRLAMGPRFPLQSRGGRFWGEKLREQGLIYLRSLSIWAVRWLWRGPAWPSCRISLPLISVFGRLV